MIFKARVVGPLFSYIISYNNLPSCLHAGDVESMPFIEALISQFSYRVGKDWIYMQLHMRQV
jgi:hypothetical protein